MLVTTGKMNKQVAGDLGKRDFGRLPRVQHIFGHTGFLVCRLRRERR